MTHIAHQWKQPLSQINSVVANIEADFEDKKQDSKKLEEHLNEIEKLTFYMSDTIENFKNYLWDDIIDFESNSKLKDTIKNIYGAGYKIL
ncbi:hypothetical protein [Halarcobacter anaerophilus]|uniref:hypothetical protein n=1 Tax=Halarcobacter anaerophilus TaxID=877500 RepID=UPI0005CB0108|nr:hypothetical protein [Halarcobacter anaerophilus]